VYASEKLKEEFLECLMGKCGADRGEQVVKTVEEKHEKKL
jgi:hypothetical protein